MSLNNKCSGYTSFPAFKYLSFVIRQLHSGQIIINDPCTFPKKTCRIQRILRVYALPSK